MPLSHPMTRLLLAVFLVWTIVPTSLCDAVAPTLPIFNSSTLANENVLEELVEELKDILAGKESCRPDSYSCSRGEKPGRRPPIPGCK